MLGNRNKNPNGLMYFASVCFSFSQNVGRARFSLRNRRTWRLAPKPVPVCSESQSLKTPVQNTRHAGGEGKELERHCAQSYRNLFPRVWWQENVAVMNEDVSKRRYSTSPSAVDQHRPGVVPWKHIFRLNVKNMWSEHLEFFFLFSFNIIISIGQDILLKTKKQTYSLLYLYICVNITINYIYDRSAEGRCNPAGEENRPRITRGWCRSICNIHCNTHTQTVHLHTTTRTLNVHTHIQIFFWIV